MIKLGSRLKKLRLQKKLSQKEFAKLFNLAESTIGMYERGERKPDYETLLLIADYFKVSTDYLLGNSDNAKTLNQDFEKFKNNPTLERWFKELPNSEEEDLEALKDMWEIIQRNKNK